MAPCTPREAKRARAETCNDAVAYVQANRGRELTKAERLDVLHLYSVLQSQAVAVAQHEPIAATVAQMLGRSSRTVQQNWARFKAEQAVAVALPPAYRQPRPSRISYNLKAKSVVQKFIRMRCETRTRTVARDVLDHLAEKGIA
ncbi:TPA: hypothetical protein N0F65_006216 [Lagenidium giganteum]|uniref:Transposase n=1 Tax=Lagenidium giganteum TaxID=4803 RepID=A0AAV2Z5I5_9STRA|nr:TPA: hypothetical protein N0F65_006216 [Lagenidium giganteum]